MPLNLIQKPDNYIIDAEFNILIMNVKDLNIENYNNY